MRQDGTAHDRRRKCRMTDPVPVRVRGAGPGGKAYRFETVARDIGAGGLCALAPRVMKSGEPIFLRIRFARAGSRPAQAPEFSVQGRVVRVEEQADGFFLFAVSFGV